jgi:hypothetical protein
MFNFNVCRKGKELPAKVELFSLVEVDWKADLGIMYTEHCTQGSKMFQMAGVRKSKI